MQPLAGYRGGNDYTTFLFTQATKRCAGKAPAAGPAVVRRPPARTAAAAAQTGPAGGWSGPPGTVAPTALGRRPGPQPRPCLSSSAAVAVGKRGCFLLGDQEPLYSGLTGRDDQRLPARAVVSLLDQRGWTFRELSVEDLVVVEEAALTADRAGSALPRGGVTEVRVDEHGTRPLPAPADGQLANTGQGDHGT